MGEIYDVVVIGGGIIGLSISYFLLKTGNRVALIEKNEIGSGASGACDEMILLQSKRPGLLLEMAMESLEMYRGLSKELKTDICFENRGGMIFIENQQQLQVMEKFIKSQRKNGLMVEMLDKKEIRKKQPHAKKEIIASTYGKDDSQVYPLWVMKGFLSRGLNMGLTVKKKINIQDIEEKKDCWKIIFDNHSFIETQYIVNAAGAWASDIGKMIGIDIPIIPKRGQIAVTEQIPSIGQTNAWSAEYIVSKLKPDLMKQMNEKYSEAGIGFAFSQGTAGNCLIGSTRETAGFNKDTTTENLNIIINQAVKFFPVLRHFHIIRSFAGLRPTTFDGKPILCEVENRKGFFIAAGHGGDGIALAPITGKVMANLINGKKVNYAMDELNLNRFV